MQLSRPGPVAAPACGFYFRYSEKRMGKPVTLLEQLCGHAMSFGAQSFETERTDGRQRAFAQIDGARTRIDDESLLQAAEAMGAVAVAALPV